MRLNELRNIVPGFFKSRFWQSCQEVGWLTLFAFAPLLLNILLNCITSKDVLETIRTKIIPGEILSYSLSFIAPLFYLIIKTQGNSYKLPFFKTIFILSLFIYCATLLLYIVAKNDLISGIDFSADHRDLYFWLSLLFLVSTFLLRMYAIYHSGGFTDWKYTREKQQNDFNAQFINSIDQSTQ